MKIIVQYRSVNRSNELLLYFDVSKDTLNLFNHYERAGQIKRAPFALRRTQHP